MAQDPPTKAAAKYADEVAAIFRGDSTTEASYYPHIRDLWATLLASRSLPFRVIAETSHLRGGSPNPDKPDIALYDRGDFVSVFGEVKVPTVEIVDLAPSTDRNDQIGRYLSQTGVVLLSNVRSVGLLATKAGYKRQFGKPVPPISRDLLQVVDLWPSEAAFKKGGTIRRESIDELAMLLERAATEFAPIADPASLARILARLAKHAKADVPKHFDAVEPLLKDYQAALGLTFEGEEGVQFFRSSLIQTAFYGLFAGWTLWHRSNDGTKFEWERIDRYLRIPFLGKLFYEFRHPDLLEELRLAPHLDRATAALQRVDEKVFFERFTYAAFGPGTDITAAAETAITYFYEPFLEAFDPDLRKELGVWYTPPDVVRYQVQKVETLLRDRLGCKRGFADERVIVLDPCCGTGTYLLEVVRRIADELRGRGDDAILPAQLLQTVCTRVLGFEILTAPFVIAQLQIYLALADLGAAPGKSDRPAVFLTNALTGWEGGDQIKLNFPELKKEHDSAQRVKRDAKIIVIMGNPPYNRFTAAAVAEEADLVDHYKGITRKRRMRGGKPVLKANGEPEMIQDGDSDLYTQWGIRKQLLEDLYVRFFRLAEKRIGEKAEHGVVSFISNYSYLTGRSNPIMRESLLKNFHEIWLDNLNGDKYKTGKIIPEGLPGQGTSDQSIFTTTYDARGIQLGTCVATLLKKDTVARPPTATVVHYREFWGLADAKRRALGESHGLENLGPAQKRAVAGRPEGPRPYETIAPSLATRWMFSPRDINAGFEAWPALDELFPATFMGVNTGKDAGVISFEQQELDERITRYLDEDVSDHDIEAAYPYLMKKANEFDDPPAFRRAMQAAIKVAVAKKSVRPYLYRPLDARFIWYETARRVFATKKGRWSGALVQRYGEEFKAAIELTNEYLVAVSQPRKKSETRPLISRTLLDYHVQDRGSTCFPSRTVSGAGFLQREHANLAEKAWQALQRSWHLKGELEDEVAVDVVRELFVFALAVMHSPRYEEEHADSLAQDWAHLPIPKAKAVFKRIADAGSKVRSMLDPDENPDGVVMDILGKRTNGVGVIRRIGGGSVAARDLNVTISYSTSAKGRWVPRTFAGPEDPLTEWGTHTGDLFINDAVMFANVPEKVWEYQLGGYPLLKKWLGYRNERALSLHEAQHFRSIVQRIAALLAMHPKLDDLYEEATKDAFTAEELGLRKPVMTAM